MKYSHQTGNVKAPKNLPKPMRGHTSGPVSILPTSEGKMGTVKSYSQPAVKGKSRNARSGY